MVSLEDIDAVSAMSDPVKRNNRITAVYHELAVDLAKRSGGPDLTWCAFATWASLSAGKMIAGNEVPVAFRQRIGNSERYQAERRGWHRVLGHYAVLRLVEIVSRRVAAAVAAGNLLVFAELGPVFVALAEGAPPPPQLPAVLADAFRRYEIALTSADPEEAAQNMLAANVMAVAYEQKRLQPHIVTAFDVGIRETLRGLPRGRPLRWVVRRLEALWSPLLRSADTCWDSALTHYATTMVTPEATFNLGHDVPPLPGGDRWPPALRELQTPEPATIVGRYDRTHGSLAGSAAHDWAKLDSRMNYIVNLFRTRQQQESLLRPPAFILRPPG
jgi:hypothetical protein